MRLFLSVLLVCAISSAYLADDPARMQEWVGRAQALFAPLFFKRELRIEGASILSRREIEGQLPLDRTNAWWRTHLAQVPEALLQSPLIAAAVVRPCSGLSLDCFVLTVEERQPAFIAVMADESRAWLVGQDGGFIAPLTHKQFQEGVLRVFGEKARRLVVVRGLWGAKSSPDEVKNRLQWVTQSLRALSEGSSLAIREVQLRESSEIRVLFDEAPFPVLFELSAEALPDLSEKGRQLKRLIAELGQQKGTVREVDFALKKMAVVRY